MVYSFATTSVSSWLFYREGCSLNIGLAHEVVAGQ